MTFHKAYMPYVALGDLTDDEVQGLMYVSSLIAIYKAATHAMKLSTKEEKDMDADFHYHMAHECVKHNFEEAAMVFVDTALAKYPEYLRNIDLNAMSPNASKSYKELANLFPERFKK